MITIQYLEPGSHISKITPELARDKLRIAFEILPFDALLLGWELPAPLLRVCRQETERLGVPLYRWHPLCTGNDRFFPKPKWRTQNFEFEPLSGFRKLREFTFACPNHPDVRKQALSHLSDITQEGVYEGVFLDRMRFPSPVENPIKALACFCEHCQRAASTSDLDFAETRQYLLRHTPVQLLRDLCSTDSNHNPITRFMRFRQKTISEFIASAIDLLRSAGLAVGLDCFSPSLMPLVGQNLETLAPLADWTKLMIYGHARGPATLPFEIGALLKWLGKTGEIPEPEAIAFLFEILGCQPPESLEAMQNVGFSPECLASEYHRGRQAGGRARLLAGIELVEMPGVSELSRTQIEADLHALKAGNAAGLALSWDLWHIPIERLELVRDIWL